MHQTVNVSLHYFVKYKYITIITKNILVNEKKTLQTNTAVNDLYDTEQCGSSVKWIIHCNVGLKCFFSFTKMFFVIIISLSCIIFHRVVWRHICGVVKYI